LKLTSYLPVVFNAAMIFEWFGISRAGASALRPARCEIRELDEAGSRLSRTLWRKMKCAENLFGLQLSEIGMLQCASIGFLLDNDLTLR
jgi:hypothetical protein